MKVRSDSALAQLTKEQLAILYDWILASGSYTEAQQRALKPAPDGFGLHIHITTLRRFYQDYTAWLREQEPMESRVTNPADLVSGAQTEIAHAIHALAHSPTDAAHLKIVTTFLNQQREASLKEGFLELARQQSAATQERLALERERMAEQKRQWEFDAAREVMKNYIEYDKIHRRRDIDQHAKIWKARDIAFGQPPVTSGPPRPLVGEESEVRGSESVESVKSVVKNSAPTHTDTDKHDLPKSVDVWSEETHHDSRSERPKMGNNIVAALGTPPDTDKHNFPNSSPGTAGILPAPSASLSSLPSVQPEILHPPSLNPHPCTDVPPQVGPAVPAGRPVQPQSESAKSTDKNSDNSVHNPQSPEPAQRVPTHSDTKKHDNLIPSSTAARSVGQP